MAIRFLRSLLVFSILLQSALSFAQSGRGEGRGCYTPAPPAEWDAWFNQLTEQYRQDQSAARWQSTTYKLPVVVHVIHAGEPTGTYPNLSNQQIMSQISVLNADFSGTGNGVTKLPQPFVDDLANCGIEFSMAQLDPSGKPLAEPGIHRVDWHTVSSTADPQSPTSSSGFQGFFDQQIKPLTIWDPTRYFNIWVSDVRSTLDLLGYATFPSGTGLNGIFSGGGDAETDGVWIWAGAFGTINIAPPYHLGRTATHEIGHWLGLRHIWGDASCGNDYCSDTPVQQGSNLGCSALFPKISCANGPDGEMYMNFMDYGDDPCIYMFTWDQCTRMHTALNNGEYRKNLAASSATLCDLPPTDPQAAFDIPSTACTNTYVVIQNASSGLPWPMYSWQVTPHEGAQIAQDEQTGDLILVLPAPGLYTISLSAINSKSSDTLAQVLSLDDCGIPAGISGEERVPARIFPNPGEGAFTITGQPAMFLEVDVFDLTGAILATGSGTGSVDVDLRQLPPGIYFAEIRQGQGREVQKLIVTRYSSQ